MHCLVQSMKQWIVFCKQFLYVAKKGVKISNGECGGFLETCHNESPSCLVVHLGLRILITVCQNYLPLISEKANFSLKICSGDNFQTIKGINLKLHTLIEHIMET